VQHTSTFGATLHLMISAPRLPSGQVSDVPEYLYTDI